MRCTLGVDIGTSSSKGVLAGEDGAILASATRAHEVDRPQVGWVEMDARIWWDEFVEITRELLAAVDDAEVVAVGVSGMGPCVVLADEQDEPVRPAILYGVDTRAIRQIERLTEELGIDEITRVVKVVVYVASDPDFSEQPQVANGASELLSELFGEAGRHVRSAVGVAVLPLNVPVELELTVEARA